MSVQNCVGSATGKEVIDHAVAHSGIGHLNRLLHKRVASLSDVVAVPDDRQVLSDNKIFDLGIQLHRLDVRQRDGCDLVHDKAQTDVTLEGQDRAPLALSARRAVALGRPHQDLTIIIEN